MEKVKMACSWATELLLMRWPLKGRWLDFYNINGKPCQNYFLLRR